MGPRGVLGQHAHCEWISLGFLSLRCLEGVVMMSRQRLCQPWRNVSQQS